MEQSLVDRGDGVEQIESKVGSIRSTDSLLRPYMPLVYDIVLSMR